MLILFDLDDTLIATSASLTPIKLKIALEKMIEEGLQVDDFDASFHLLKTLDQTSESARVALAMFLEQVGGEKKFFDIAVKEVYESDDLNFKIDAVEGALALLEELKKEHTLALVTAGMRERQLKKMESAGIDSQTFSKIVVCESHEKKTHYQKIIAELNVELGDVIVCGDRIASDLTPAKELGIRTVHFKYGRGLHAKGRNEDVDHVIEKLVEIKEIINRRNPNENNNE